MVTAPELLGTHGAVASTHWLASGAGMAVLDAGGNAFDAAVTAGLVLQVVEPASNGLGGDVAIVVHEAATEDTRVVCGQGPMPRAATIRHFESLGLRQIPGSGLLPACVPGAFGAWLRLLAQFGSLRLAEVVRPAVELAAGGYPVLPATARTIRTMAPLFRTEWPGSARAFLPHGSAPAENTRLRNPDLAATLQRIVHEAECASTDREAQIEAAHRAFYEGFVADRIDRFVQQTEVLDATGRRHRGLLRGQDLADWAPTVEEPAMLSYRDQVVFKPGIWSQGPTFLQQLALLDEWDLTSISTGTAEYVHTLVETTKLAFADREAWYGDSQPTTNMLDALLDPDYTAHRRSLIRDEAASSPQPGAPQGRAGVMPWVEPDRPAPQDVDWMRQLGSGMPTIVAATARSGDTCTIVAADRHGNMVAAVPSGGWLKSSPMIDGLGLALGTRGQTMWLSPGHPNSLAPGRRPRSTLSPTVCLRDGRAHLAFGTPGGDHQDQWTLQAFLANTSGLDLQRCVEQSAFHTDHFPSSFAPRGRRPGVVVMEQSWDPAVVTELSRRGHAIDVVPAWSLGKVCMVGRDAGSGFLRAAAGPRGRQAYASCH